MGNEIESALTLIVPDEDFSTSEFDKLLANYDLAARSLDSFLRGEIEFDDYLQIAEACEVVIDDYLEITESNLEIMQLL